MADLDITFTNLSQLSRAYGAPAVDLAGRVLQKGAQFQIASGLGLAAGAVVLLIAASYCCSLEVRWSRAWKTRETGGPWPADTPVWAIPGTVFGFLFGGAAMILAGGMLADGWAWIALSDPNLALAHRVFGSMGG